MTLTCVMLGANTIAMLCAFILLKCSSCTTSAIRLIPQSKSAACMGGSVFTNATASSSVLHCITCSGERLSNTPLGSSRNHACKSRYHIDKKQRQRQIGYRRLDWLKLNTGPSSKGRKRHKGKHLDQACQTVNVNVIWHNAMV